MVESGRHEKPITVWVVNCRDHDGNPLEAEVAAVEGQVSVTVQGREPLWFNGFATDAFASCLLKAGNVAVHQRNPNVLDQPPQLTTGTGEDAFPVCQLPVPVVFPPGWWLPNFLFSRQHFVRRNVTWRDNGYRRLVAVSVCGFSAVLDNGCRWQGWPRCSACQRVTTASAALVGFGGLSDDVASASRIAAGHRGGIGRCRMVDHPCTSGRVRPDAFAGDRRTGDHDPKLFKAQMPERGQVNRRMIRKCSATGHSACPQPS